MSAATAFRQVGDVAKQAKPELIAALWDSNWFVRSKVTTTISSIGLEANDIPNLVEPFRNNPQPDNGAIVSLMLATYSPVQGKLENLPLFFIAGLNHKDPKVRENSALALGQISLTRPGYPHLTSSTNGLIKVIQDQDVKVRHSSVEELGRVLVGFREKYDIEESQKKGNPFPAPHNIYPYSSKIIEIEAVLLSAIQDQDASVRKAAVESLKGLRFYQSNSPEKVILALLIALQDQDPNVRQSAADVLSQLFKIS